MALRAKTLKQVLIVALIWLCPAALPAVTPPLPAQPAQYVVDLAGVLDANTRTRLNARLQDLEAKTTAQVVVLTLNSLEGEPIESFSHQTSVKWGIGQKGKDNGVLLTVAVKDRKYRIEVGYGLESTLPDSLVGSLGRQFLVPHFKKGDFAGGIVAVVAEISNTISGGKAVSQGGQGTKSYHWETVSKKNFSGSWSTGLLFLVFIILLFFLRPRFFVWWGGGGSSGGGWSSGGGSGGFSGGGGDFGGGGASGDW